jgi:hypothetical protein
MYSLKTYFKVLLSKKQHFWGFLSQKVQETACFRRRFVIFGRPGAYLPPLTPSTTTPCPVTLPANNRRTKQFL